MNFVSFKLWPRRASAPPLASALALVSVLENGYDVDAV